MFVLKWLGGAVALFVLWALVRTPSPEEQAQRDSERAISSCWDQQGKKSLEPSAARLAAGACERMDSEYVAKYGRKP